MRNITHISRETIRKMQKETKKIKDVKIILSDRAGKLQETPNLKKQLKPVSMMETLDAGDFKAT